ncbi:hypothetical protein A7G45_23935 [Mycolicibacterium llatzerense]|uniref:hypothetical protein n=1 Tax=Mycolicibacterium TaxID=1866885 RepID=UPI0008DE2946|nr:hypothetical protein [Mycolicibacterium llatzerense]
MLEVCKAIRAEYQSWARRRLDEITLDYLFLDASFFRMHPGSPAEPMLAAWGITTEGKPVFVGLTPGTGDSTGVCRFPDRSARTRPWLSAAGRL